MDDKSSQILALKAFQSKVGESNSLEVLFNLIDAFIKEQVEVDSVEILKNIPNPPESSTAYSAPIGDTGFWLKLIPSSPLSDDEISIVEMMIALVAVSPIFLSRIDLGPFKKQILGSSRSNNDGMADSLQHAINQIHSSLERDTILDNLLKAVRDIIAYEAAFALVYTDDMLQVRASLDSHGQPFQTLPDEAVEVWANSPLVYTVLKTKNTLSIADISANSQWVALYEDPEVRSWIASPISLNDELLGILSINSYHQNFFGDQEKRLVSTLASQAAVALKNANAFLKTNQQLAELTTLYQASATMTANLDQDFVLETVVTEMVRALKLDSCTIFVWDESKQSLILAAHENVIFTNQTGDQGERNQTIGLGKIENLEEHPVLRRVFETREIHSLRRDSILNPDETTLLDAAELHSILLLPLVRQENVLGLLALGQMSQRREFEHKELRLAQNLASQAAVAIEHAHLYSQAQRRVEELSAFQDIILQLNTPLKLNAVLDAITEAALKLVGASNLHIYLYNSVTDVFTFGSALWRDGRQEPAVSAPRSDGLTSSVVRKGEPIVINKASEHALYQTEEAQSWGVCAIAGFPLKHGDQVIGAFTATYLYPHSFTKDELLLLNLLADQAAVAVRNAGLFAGSQRRLKDMSALVDMAKQVTGNLKLKDVLQTTVQILKGLLNCRASTITMLSEDGEELVVAATAGVDPAYHRARMKLGQGISGEVVRNNELIYIQDAHSDPDFLFFDEVVRSLLVVPLIIRDETIGTMTVDSGRPNAFSESDIQLMTIAAAQVSVAIDNARFIEQLEARAAELARAYQVLKESDRLKDELVQNVSHELRTPLTFVKGYVDLLIEGEMGEVSQRQMDALKIVADKTTDITRLIEDIITLQRINSNNLQLEEVAFNDLIKTTIAGHRLVADKKGLEVALSVPETNVMVKLDKARINQVLDNIIGNAMKFSPGGGTITVILTEEESDVQVMISDEGIGVPKDQHERIFERFYQVDGSARRRFGGTGVGLAIVKRIVDAHQGKIWVESEVGEGSSFFVRLPKYQPVIGEARQKSFSFPGEIPD